MPNALIFCNRNCYSIQNILLFKMKNALRKHVKTRFLEISSKKSIDSYVLVGDRSSCGKSSQMSFLSTTDNYIRILER
jgi:hypothetical protein